MTSIIPVLQVLIIGFGFMGENHFNNLKELEKTEQVQILGIVESDPSKFNNPKLNLIADRCFISVEDAYSAGLKPDIIVVASNTAAHYQTIQQIFTQCAYRGLKPPALFVEKPLVENCGQAEEIIETLHSYGYGKDIPFTCGYLFRDSPALDRCFGYINDDHFQIDEIQTIWQKLRDTKRPSAGVHIDEATHPVDILVNYLFHILELPRDQITLTVHDRKSSLSIVNPELQKKFYGPDHIPLAAVDYEMNIGAIPVKCHSSFMEAPQRREIWLKNINQSKTIVVSFDEKNADHFIVLQDGNEILRETFDKPNKLLLEWKAWLATFNGSQNPVIPTLLDAYVDIAITQALGEEPIGKKKTFAFIRR